MTEPQIIHQSVIAVSGRKMVLVVRVMIALWLIITALVFYFSRLDPEWGAIAILLFGAISLVLFYLKIKSLPKSPGTYRMLVSGQQLIRESSHPWFGTPFSIPLASISGLLVETWPDGEGFNTVRYYLRLTDSSRIEIIGDYKFSPESLFDALVKLSVVNSITREVH